MHKVKKAWTLQAFLFLQAKENQQGAPKNEEEMRHALDSHIKGKIQALAHQIPSKQSMKELAARLSGRKNCDVNRLEEICSNFQQSMLQYKHEFSEQKVTLVDDAEMKKQVLSDIRKTL